MRIEISCPEWMEKATVTLRLTELTPHSAEALIETLRDALPADDDRFGC